MWLRSCSHRRGRYVCVCVFDCVVVSIGRGVAYSHTTACVQQEGRGQEEQTRQERWQREEDALLRQQAQWWGQGQEEEEEEQAEGEEEWDDPPEDDSEEEEAIILGPGDVYIPDSGEEHADGGPPSSSRRRRRRRQRVRRREEERPQQQRQQQASWVPSMPAWLSSWWLPLPDAASLPSHRVPSQSEGMEVEAAVEMAPRAALSLYDGNKGDAAADCYCASDLSSDDDEEEEEAEEEDEHDARHVRLPAWAVGGRRSYSHASAGSLGVAVAGARRRLAEGIGSRIRARSFTHASIPVTDEGEGGAAGRHQRRLRRQQRRRRRRLQGGGHGSGVNGSGVDDGGLDPRRVSNVRSAAASMA